MLIVDGESGSQPLTCGLALLLLPLSILLAACSPPGGGDDVADPAPASSVSASPSSEPTTEPSPTTEDDPAPSVAGRSTNFSEIIEVHSEFEVVIFDCQLQDPERGLFDIETGERFPGIDPIAEGQKDVKRVTMRLVDGVWKVFDVQGQENRICEHAPTTQALPNI